MNTDKKNKGHFQVRLTQSVIDQLREFAWTNRLRMTDFFEVLFIYFLREMKQDPENFKVKLKEIYKELDTTPYSWR